MENDRRKFLASAGTLGIASLVWPGVVFADSLDSQLAGPGYEDFTARIKDWFYLYTADTSHQGDLKLTKVRDSGSTAEIQQFALVLRSRRGAQAMPSGIYEVAGEAFNLYLKHTHESKNKQYYSAEFALLQ